MPITLRSREENKGSKNECKQVNVICWLSSFSQGYRLLIFLVFHTSSINTCTWFAIHSNNVPIISCIGIIHDFLRPTLSKKRESTMGDQSNLNE